LKAIPFNDPLDTAGADLDTGLAELLSDDVDRGVGIEETVTNDLAFDLLGPDGVGLGSAFLTLKGENAPFLELREQLMITLSTHTILHGSPGPAEFFAFSLDEHEQPRGDLVVGADDEVASGPDDAAL
jgi:hypothetical protein